jgi:hypothetical protein
MIYIITNKFTAGTHKVKLTVTSPNYKGSATTKLVISKAAGKNNLFPLKCHCHITSCFVYAYGKYTSQRQNRTSGQVQQTRNDQYHFTISQNCCYCQLHSDICHISCAHEAGVHHCRCNNHYQQNEENRVFLHQLACFTIFHFRSPPYN